MHHLCGMSRRKALSLERSSPCQVLVRFFALLRIKPHNPPLVRAPSIPLSFNLAIVLPRWNTYCVYCGTQGVSPRTPSIHRLQCGLPGYLILFAPHTFAPHRQLSSSNPPSPQVFLLISTHFTATLGIPLSSPALKKNSFYPLTGLSPALLR